MANNAKQIKHIEDILNSGVDSVTVDGTSTRVNIKQLRRRLQELRAEDPNFQHKARKRIKRINLGGAW